MVQLTEHIVNNGAVHEPNRDGETILFLLAKHNDADALTLLFNSADINVNKRNMERLTPLHIAASGGHIGAVEIISSQSG